MFFLISKEFLFYGEERLIVLSYLTLFTSLFFVLGSSLSSSFSQRTEALKAEFDLFFDSIITLLQQTKKLINNFSFFNLKVLRLFSSIWLEFAVYFANYSNYSWLKFNFVKFKFMAVLGSSSLFYTKLLNLFYSNVLPSFFNKVISWKMSNTAVWIRRLVIKSSAKTKVLPISSKKVNSSKFWWINLKSNSTGSTVNSNFNFNITRY